MNIWCYWIILLSEQSMKTGKNFTTNLGENAHSVRTDYTHDENGNCQQPMRLSEKNKLLHTQWDQTEHSNFNKLSTD